MYMSLPCQRSGLLCWAQPRSVHVTHWEIVVHGNTDQKHHGIAAIGSRAQILYDRVEAELQAVTVSTSSKKNSSSHKNKMDYSSSGARGVWRTSWNNGRHYKDKQRTSAQPAFQHQIACIERYNGSRRFIFLTLALQATSQAATSEAA